MLVEKQVQAMGLGLVVVQAMGYNQWLVLL